MNDIKSQSIAKIDEAMKKFQGDRYTKVLAPYAANVLKQFCKDNEEFAQAVMDGGSFEECMKHVAHGVSSSISDLDVCQRAAEFYFPGSVIEFQMKIYTSKYEAFDGGDKVDEGYAEPPITLNLEDFI